MIKCNRVFWDTAKSQYNTGSEFYLNYDYIVKIQLDKVAMRDPAILEYKLQKRNIYLADTTIDHHSNALLIISEDLDRLLGTKNET